MDKLEEWRKQIDKIDEKLLMLISKRLELAKKISSWKKKHSINIVDKKREMQVINNMLKEATRLGISKGLAEGIFKRIMKEARKTEKCKK